MSREIMCCRAPLAEPLPMSYPPANPQRDQFAGEVRGLQGSFDIFAATYAQDGELSKGQLDSLPAAAQQILDCKPEAAAKA